MADNKPLSQEPVKTRALTPIEAFRGDVTKLQPQFEMALPPHVKAERFARILVTAVQQNEKLLDLDRKSLFASAMKAAQDGLLPDGREAALVPFKDQVQYMPMVGGILKKVRNSGELLSISVKVVREDEAFRYWVDEKGEHLHHEPMLEGTSKVVTHVYAIARTKDGGVYIEVMSREDIEKIRAVSKASTNGPWVAWWDEMAKKTVIRRLSKRLPMSTDLEDVIHRDDEMYDLGKVEAKTVETGKPSRLEKIVSSAAVAGSQDAPGSHVAQSEPGENG